MWLHLPTIQSASAPDTEELNLDSIRLSQLEQSAMWKSKFRQQRSWLLVWKKDISIKRLSGLTLKPSTLNHGVEKWISSQVDSHVSHSVLQGKEKNKTMIETSGQMSQNSLGDLGFQSSFLKMFPESLDTTGTPYDLNYERWVTKLRKDSSRRQKQAHLIKEKDFLSWRTPQASNLGSRNKGYGKVLNEEAKNWPTPRARDDFGPQRSMVDGQCISPDGQRWGLDLPMAAVNWPTPTTQKISHKDMEVNEKGRRMTKDKKDSHSLNLQDTTANWTTPLADDTGMRKKKFAQGGTALSLQALEEEKSWPTPEIYPSIPPDPKKQIDGHTCSVSCRRLNPHFAEWLMGLCLGWTSVSEPLETESFQAWQQSLSELLQKISD